MLKTTGFLLGILSHTHYTPTYNKIYQNTPVLYINGIAFIDSTFKIHFSNIIIQDYYYRNGDPYYLSTPFSVFYQP